MSGYNKETLINSSLHKYLRYTYYLLEARRNGNLQASELYEQTGTPFVDAGIAVICKMANKKTPEDIDFTDLKNSTEKLVEIYTSESWSKPLYSIFPNSLLTNPSSKKKGDLRQKYLFFLLGLIKDIETESSGESICISCGRHAVVKPKLRMDIPLIGSGDLLNFFPAAKGGADYCSACTLAVQFFPISTRKGAELFTIHSSSMSLLKSWAYLPVKTVNNELAIGELNGPLSTKSNVPKNALFEFATDIIRDLEENEYPKEDTRQSVELIQFTNFQQGPDLRIHNLPVPVFQFLLDIQHDEKNKLDWAKIVSRNYRRKKNNDVDYSKPNPLYQSLIDGRSAVYYFIDTTKRENLCGWKLVKSYLEDVKKMEKERILKIREIADRLGDYFLDGNHKRLFFTFESCKSYPIFRNQLRKIQKDCVLSSLEGVPFTFDDYVDFLFPESIIDWKETRDLMLFRIYEKISASGLRKEFADNEIKEEIEEE